VSTGAVVCAASRSVSSSPFVAMALASQSSSSSTPSPDEDTSPNEKQNESSNQRESISEDEKKSDTTHDGKDKITMIETPEKLTDDDWKKIVPLSFFFCLHLHSILSSPHTFLFFTS